MAKSGKGSKALKRSGGKIASKAKGFASSPLGKALILEGVALGAIALTRSKRVRAAASRAGEKASYAASSGKRAAAKGVKAVKTTTAKGVAKAAKGVRSLGARGETKTAALEAPSHAESQTARRRKPEPKKIRSR